MKCILCKSVVNREHNYYFCSNCELIFKEKHCILSENDEKDRYLLHNNTILDEKYVSYFRNIADVAVVPYVSGKNGLDYGSGASNVFEEVLKKWYGFEVKSYDKYFCDNSNLKKEYDFITCIEVIEHIYNPIEFFKELDNFLGLDGCLIFKTSFHNNDVSKFFNWWYIRDETHITFYTYQTFKYLANKFNYKIVFCDKKSIIVMKKL